MKVLVFVPHNPFPCRSGAHRRMLEMLIGLRALGAKVALAGAENALENPWTQHSRDWLEREELCESVSVYAPPGRTPLVERLARGWQRGVNAFNGNAPGRQQQIDWTTPPMRRWFAQVLESSAPDRVLINYAGYAPLLGSREGSGAARAVVDAHDLITLNDSMRRALSPLMPPGSVFSPDAVDEAALDRRFFDSDAEAVAPAEFAALDRFDVTLAITDRDAEAMRRGVRATHVVALPTPVPVGNERPLPGPLALLPMGPHLFNLQGYAWFVRKVLPLICAECPGFELAVSGTLPPNTTLEYHPNVRILGFVREPAELWAMARMLVNPVFGGTGQPIKTLEAMAAGVPPVVLSQFVHAAPLEHGVSGFVAENEKEFAHYCVQLWQRPELVHAMGRAAMETVRSACSRERFATVLGHVLSERNAHAA